MPILVLIAAEAFKEPRSGRLQLCLKILVTPSKKRYCTEVGQQSSTTKCDQNHISLVNLATTKARAKHELLFNKLVSEAD